MTGGSNVLGLTDGSKPSDPKIHAAKDPKLSRPGCRKVQIMVAGNDFLKDRARSFEGD